MPLEILYRPLKELVPNPRNARTHSASQIATLKGLLAQIGLPAERLQIVHLGLGQAHEFVRVVEEMTERLRALGASIERV